MNRLILIGNGFDLAHGLKTSYKDFITDYLCSAISEFYQNKTYEDELVKINYKSSMVYGPRHHTIGAFEDVISIINGFKKDGICNFKYKSSFFESLIVKVDRLNWVDIENEYFERLKECKLPRGFDYDRVNKLNDELGYIKDKLEEYLSKVQNNHSGRFNPTKYSRIFTQQINHNEIVTVKMQENVLPNTLHILNFNYTYTIDSYYATCHNHIPTEVNFIHGELNNIENPLIFGFGDEFDKNYNEFEDHKNNLLFKHIKSFGYFKTRNYHNLIRFLDSDDFQVFIIGHSCGLSDRTMLKQIFEHERCKSIKIFHHRRSDNSNDYTEKTYEIARHFTNKGLMRKKIVPFDPDNYMP